MYIVVLIYIHLTEGVTSMLASMALAPNNIACIRLYVCRVIKMREDNTHLFTTIVWFSNTFVYTMSDNRCLRECTPIQLGPGLKQRIGIDITSTMASTGQASWQNPQ